MLPSERLQVGATYSRRDLSIKFKIALAFLQRRVVRARDYASIWLFLDEGEGEAVKLPEPNAEGVLDMIVDHVARGVEVLLFTRDATGGKGAYRYRGPVTFARRDDAFIYFAGAGEGGPAT